MSIHVVLQVLQVMSEKPGQVGVRDSQTIERLPDDCGSLSRGVNHSVRENQLGQM